MSQTQAIFDRFRHQTGDTSAAAMLTLAYAMLDCQQEKPLSVREAAQRKGVGDDLIYRACKEGHLKHEKIGRTIRIRPADLEAADLSAA